MSLPYLHPYLGLSNGLNTLHAAGGGGGAGVGGWVELGRTTLGSAGDNIDITSLDDKRYYMLLTYVLDSGSMTPRLRLNSDTGTNYAIRGSTNGGADSTVPSADTMAMANFSGEDIFQVQYVANYATKEKLVISHSIDQVTAGASTAPSRSEFVGKHAQTSNPISAVNVVNQNAGSFASGSEVVVLGWDPADSHTNNFWEELGTDSGTGSTLDVSFTSKKYLWIQAYVGDAESIIFQCGNSSVDTGNNYAMRYSTDGGADATSTSRANLIPTTGSSNHFLNMFVINNASNEKLFIVHTIAQNTAGATNAPSRRELVGKWVNTSNQINVIKLTAGSSYSAESIVKVWGAD